MLQTDGIPVSVRLYIGRATLRGLRHCVWGDLGSPARSTTHSNFGEIDAYKAVEIDLGERRYCTNCWIWLGTSDETCPTCDSSENVTNRGRRIRGWLGIQRFLHEQDYGIDLLRHGRKIEVGNKDLFIWDGESGPEREYPIDDQRARGRIVGEIHLDHCRVSYTKDRFERTDIAWSDMVRLIRGAGPLRPNRSRELGIPVSETPLNKLYQGFRRSTPKIRRGGGYARLLLVPDNKRANEMTRQFQEGDPEYQTDEKWYELAEVADREALGGGGEAVSPDDFFDDDPDPKPAGGEEPAPPPPLPARSPLPSMSRVYRDDFTELRWEVLALETEPSDPELRSSPWTLTRTTAGTDEFLIDLNHSCFRSSTLTPLDALLSELAVRAIDSVREQRIDVTFSQILAGLRASYATQTDLDPASLNNSAQTVLRGVALSLCKNVGAEDAHEIFKGLPGRVKESIVRRAVAAGLETQDIISTGRFLDLAPYETIPTVVTRNPELFMDGKCFDAVYESLTTGIASVDEEVRSDTLRYYEGLLWDATWLATKRPDELADATRERLTRASLGVDQLAAEVDLEETDQE